MSDARALYSLKGKRIWVAGHNGMVGSALVRRLNREECTILTASRREHDLRRQSEVDAFMAKARPEAVFLAAARVGGIVANDSRPASFLYDNLMIATNIIATCVIAQNRSPGSRRAAPALFMASRVNGLSPK